jgi:hypothetical protein
VTKVLYVEDNDDNVFMLKMRLELLGEFEVLTAEDGQKGLQQRYPRCLCIDNDYGQPGPFLHRPGSIAVHQHLGGNATSLAGAGDKWSGKPFRGAASDQIDTPNRA